MVLASSITSWYVTFAIARVSTDRRHVSLLQSHVSVLAGGMLRPRKPCANDDHGTSVTLVAARLHHLNTHGACGACWLRPGLAGAALQPHTARAPPQ